MKKGMTVAMLRSIENFKMLLDCYYNIDNGDGCSIEVSAVNVSSDPIENRKYNLLRTREAFELSIILFANLLLKNTR